MNEFSKTLCHMTKNEKADYNRKYYQTHKYLWELYRKGEVAGRNGGGTSHTVGRSGGGGGSHYTPNETVKKNSGGGSHFEPKKKTGGGSQWGNDNTLNDLYKDMPMSSKKAQKKNSGSGSHWKNDYSINDLDKSIGKNAQKKELLENPVAKIRKANNVVQVNGEQYEKKKETKTGASYRPVNQNDSRLAGMYPYVHPSIRENYEKTRRRQQTRENLERSAEASARRWVANEKNERRSETARAMDEARRKGLAKIYDGGVNRTRTVSVPTKTNLVPAEMSPAKAPVYTGAKETWNKNVDKVAAAGKSFLSGLKNTLENAAKGATRAIVNRTENGRKYAASVLSSVKATVNDMQRDASDLITEAKRVIRNNIPGSIKYKMSEIKKIINEVASGNIQFVGKEGDGYNPVTKKEFYYNTSTGQVQPWRDNGEKNAYSRAKLRPYEYFYTSSTGKVRTKNR